MIEKADLARQGEIDRQIDAKSTKQTTLCAIAPTKLYRLLSLRSDKLGAFNPNNGSHFTLN